MVFIDTYGAEALQWHPQTIRLQLREDLGLEVLQGAMDRLLAAITIVTTDYFFQDLPRFIQLCNVLGGSELDPTVFDPADSVECAWGITEALLLSPPETAEPFCEEIRFYIGKVLADEGYVQPPDVLRIAIDGDFSAKVQTDFADDPEMFGAIWKIQEDKSKEVNAVIRNNLREMLEQITRLPLQNGDTQGLVARLKQNLRPASAGA